MADKKIDVAVLGGGPGGLAAAATLALKGGRAVVINDGPLMGYGVNGAFKSKVAFEVSRQYVDCLVQKEVFCGVEMPRQDAMRADTHVAAEGLKATLVDRIQRLGIELVNGRGRFEDAHTIVVGDQRIRAESIVIATGSVPRLLPGVKVDGERVLTSDHASELPKIPRSLLVLGAGVIGCEFASIFAAFGAKVQLLDAKERVLSMEDEDLSEFLGRSFRARGIDVIPSCRFQAIENAPDGVRTRLTNGTTVTTEAVLLAVGRTPCTGNLNLEATGVKTDERGLIPTDSTMRTNISHIYAVGDVGSRNTPVDLALVHVAQAEGRCAAYKILGKTFNQNMDHVPYIIFTIPMIAGAGLSETLARERHGDVQVGKYPYGRNHRAHALHAPVGFVKLIVGPPGDDRILGVRAIGRDADSLVAAASIMIERELPYTYLLNSIFAHPSLMECLQGAAHIVAGDALQFEEGEEYRYGRTLGG